MRNAVLPSVSPSYDLFGHELQIFNNENLHNNIYGFCMDSKEFDNMNNDKYNQQSTIDNCSFQFQSNLVTYQLPAFPSSTAIFSCDIDDAISSQHRSMLLGKKILASQLEIMDFPVTRNPKKRPIAVNGILPKSGIGHELIGDQRKLSLNDSWAKTKRSKVSTNHNDQKWKQQVRETFTGIGQERKLRLPVRKSQKLTDKITALQKLVSPYGKTDTASVLQEASLYIKLLQEQIQNLFRMLSNSYDSLSNPCMQETGRRLELGSRGLCLVPISFTEKVSFKEEQNDYTHRCH